MLKVLEDLNKEQREAVEECSCPLLVLASAGSGKTRVLTYKIAYLINELHYDPFNILAITFTNKAANEMKTRLYSLVGDSISLAQVSTFHSFGLKVIKSHYKLLDLSSNFSIMDTSDSIKIIKNLIKENNFDLDDYRYIKNYISRRKNGMSISSYANQNILGTIYDMYEEFLKKNNALDFDDLLLLPIKLFKEHPEVLENYQRRFKYVLIDEYQDTNKVQYEMVKLLKCSGNEICVVGDVDQAIYGFRGADFHNILNFERDFLNSKVIKLEQNYRSTNNILDVANKVISHNNLREEKRLWSNLGKGEKVNYRLLYNGKYEAEYVLDVINSLHDKNYNYSDMAIIYRTNSQSREFEDVFMMNALPYRIVSGTSFYDRKEVKDILAYLKLINNPLDNLSLERIINVPRRGIGNKTIRDLKIKATEKNISMYEAIDSGKALNFKNMIESLKEKQEKLTISDFVETVLTETNLLSSYSEGDTKEKMQGENLKEFITLVQNHEDKTGNHSLNDFLDEISLVTDNDVEENQDDKVNLMTVHAVKGLEFKVVFVVGLEEGLFPHANSYQNISELEEERRLCYVAFTRAKELLYLTSTQMRMLYGKIHPNLVSRFIIEAGLSEKSSNQSSNLSLDNIINKDKKENYYEENTCLNYQEGDLVYHQVFGKGKIIEIMENKDPSKDILKIMFLGVGIRNISKNHKSLSKYKED